MLEAGWQLYEGEYFRHRVEISTKELEFLTTRMLSFGTTASIIGGFAFSALVELDINEDMGKRLDEAGYGWMEATYYLSIGTTMAADIYIVVVATIAVMRAQRMALHGNIDMGVIREELPVSLGYTPGMIGDPSCRAAADSASSARETRARGMSGQQLKSEDDDVQHAILALRRVQPTILFAFGLSLVTFVSAAVSMAWIKTVYLHLRTGSRLNSIAIALTAIFGLLSVSIAIVTAWMNNLFSVGKFHESAVLSPSQIATQPLRRAINDAPPSAV